MCTEIRGKLTESFLLCCIVIQVTSKGKRLSSADGSLKLASTSPVSGTDALGPFTGMTYRWTEQNARGSESHAASVLMETTFLMSADGTSLRFNASFPSGAYVTRTLGMDYFYHFSYLNTF